MANDRRLATIERRGWKQHNAKCRRDCQRDKHRRDQRQAIGRRDRLRDAERARIVEHSLQRELAIAQSQVELTVNDASQGWLAVADIDQLDQVLWALLDNAVKYGAGSPIAVDIDVEEASSRLRLTIAAVLSANRPLQSFEGASMEAPAGLRRLRFERPFGRGD